MKRWIIFQSLIFVASMFMACTDEIMMVRPPVTGEEGTLVFTLHSTGKDPETYAAVNGDDRVETLDIYMFNAASEWLVSVFRFATGELEQSDGLISVTIDVTGRVGEHRFYFVANAAGYASSLENTQIGVTTEEDFIFRLTDRRTEALTLPLLMTAYKRMARIETPAAGETSVFLQRRAARFDVKNNAPETGLTIDQILVSNATLETYLFADVHDPSITLAKGSLPPVAYSSLPGANGEQTLKGVMYLYPTEISPADNEDGLTNIWLEGTLWDETRLLNIRSRFSAEGNYSYVLKPVEHLIYPGTNLPPVSVGGVYWAPVNAGIIGNNIPEKEYGDLFQWGRNVLFAYNGTNNRTGPVQIGQSGTSTFYFVEQSPSDWLTPKNNNLWSGENARGPCPPGWRVPKQTELKLIYDLYLKNDGSVVWDITNRGYYVKGDDGISKVFLPTGGYRNGRTGRPDGFLMYGYYWSSDVTNDMAFRLFFDKDRMSLTGGYRASGYSVRCVIE